MKTTAIILAAATLVSVAPAFAASECGMQIQAIERRMHSAGASEVTGKPMSPDAKAQASNAEGHAPAPVDPAQTATPEKMRAAQAMIDKAKSQDEAGDKTGCEATMVDAQKTMGAVP
jgi:hypothetical protein